MASWLDAAPPDAFDVGGVRLRRWRSADAGLITRLVAANLEHLRPWMPWAQEVPPLDEEEDFLTRMQRAWEERLDFAYAITRPTGEAIGGIGLHTRLGLGILEIGYWIAAAETGRGFVTAAVRALTDAAFTLSAVERVEIRCDEANRASAGIPSRLGFRLEQVVSRAPTAPAETGRFMIWAVGRDEWQAPRPPA